jgi:hypothetical protein
VIVLAALIVSQVFRIDKSNPPVQAEFSAETPVNPNLRKACYDSHSKEIVGVWYSNVAMVSWLLASDVSEGRRALNFSDWGT